MNIDGKIWRKGRKSQAHRGGNGGGKLRRRGKGEGGEVEGEPVAKRQQMVSNSLALLYISRFSWVEAAVLKGDKVL